VCDEERVQAQRPRKGPAVQKSCFVPTRPPARVASGRPKQSSKAASTRLTRRFYGCTVGNAACREKEQGVRESEEGGAPPSTHKRRGGAVKVRCLSAFCYCFCTCDPTSLPHPPTHCPRLPCRSLSARTHTTHHVKAGALHAIPRGHVLPHAIEAQPPHTLTRPTTQSQAKE